MGLNYAVAPGEYLQEWLDENETTQLMMEAAHG